MDGLSKLGAAIQSACAVYIVIQITEDGERNSKRGKKITKYLYDKYEKCNEKCLTDENCKEQCFGEWQMSLNEHRRFD